MFTDEQIEKLAAPIDEGRVKVHPYTKMDYLATWDMIATANEIFGFDGWSSETTRLELVGPEFGWVATVKVAAGGVVREDSGFAPYAIGEQGLLRETVDTAVKAAVSDALKRALRSFGEQFGNTLYNKNRRGNAPQQQRPAQERGQQAGDDEWDTCPNCSKRKKARFPVCFECKEAGCTTPERTQAQDAPQEQHNPFAEYWEQVKVFMTLAQFNDEFERIRDTGHRQQKAYLLRAAQLREFTFDANTAAFVDPLARTGQGAMMDTGDAEH